MTESAAEVRNAVIAHLRKHHPDVCRHWFDNIQAVDLQGGVLRLLVGEPVQLKYLQRCCIDKFTEASQAVTRRLTAVAFVGVEDARAAYSRGSEGGRSHRAGPNGSSGSNHDEMLLSPDYTFENFVIGPDNRLAYAAARAVAQKPGKAYNPYFIHGGVGLGKTHLLQAICQQLMRDYPEQNIYYVSCDSFTNQFMESLQAGEMQDFRHRFRNVDVLVIDDIHFLARRDQTQEEFFHTFNTLYQTGRQIVLSSDAPPNVIPHLEERLVSRFNSGLVFHIDKPNYETRVAILKMKATMRNIALPDEVAAFIASKVDSNIRELEGAIATLGVMAALGSQPIDVDLARAALGATGQENGQHQPTVHNIIDVVCDYYDVKLSEILSKKKTKSIARPRQVCMWLARKLTRFSLEEIGGYFGGRDHTTVLHAVRTINTKVGSDARLAHDLEYLDKVLTDTA